MANELTRAQLRTLDKLRERYKTDPRQSFSAYDLKESLSTLNALRSKGYIVRTDSAHGHGALFYPRSVKLYRYVPPQQTVTFASIGFSDDRRTNKWRVDCVECKKAFSPLTTMLRNQSFDCPNCGVSYVADWNVPKVALKEQGK